MSYITVGQARELIAAWELAGSPSHRFSGTDPVFCAECGLGHDALHHLIRTHQPLEEFPDNGCTHGADCRVHPGTGAVHNFDPVTPARPDVTAQELTGLAQDLEARARSSVDGAALRYAAGLARDRAAAYAAATAEPPCTKVVAVLGQTRLICNAGPEGHRLPCTFTSARAAPAMRMPWPKYSEEPALPLPPLPEPWYALKVSGAAKCFDPPRGCGEPARILADRSAVLRHRDGCPNKVPEGAVRDDD